MKTIQRNWYLIDLKDQILGRIAVDIAHKLMGKQKPGFVRNQDLGDYVVAINAKSVKVTGKKAADKLYYHHTGYPQGMRVKTYHQIQEKDPRRIIFQAVRGMLPDNKLRALMLKRLYIYPDTSHPYQEKFTKKT